MPRAIVPLDGTLFHFSSSLRRSLVLGYALRQKGVRVEKATQSVLTALRVIEQVSLEQPVRVSDLARSLDLPKSSTHRVLSTLASAGWLRQDSRGEWALALRCAAIGRRVGAESALRDVARPALEDLSSSTHENARLWLVEDEAFAIIDSVDGDHAVRPVEIEMGTHIPMHATAVGKAVLASWPDHRVDGFLSRPLQRFTAETITDPDVLRSEIGRARLCGYAEVCNEAQIDVCGVAAVFRLPSDRRGALALTFPHHRLNDVSFANFGELIARAVRTLEHSVHGSAA
jgi:IclR family acetate operon transcriptional repressor